MTAPISAHSVFAGAIDPAVLRGIREASQTSSADFGLLMAQAARESGFRPDAKSPTSSAAGLFQFVDSTWLDMIHRFGAKYGVGQLAQAVSETKAGKLVVRDPTVRQKILALRDDPVLSAALAGEYAKLNQAELERAVGRPPSRGDLYLAHFLGAGGAADLLNAVATKGDTIAARLLPDAAAANPAIFYDSAGRPRTVAEIYRTVAGTIERDASAFEGDAAIAPSPTETGSNAESLALAATPPSHFADWSGVKLSPSMLAMLNVVALAALKLSEDGAANASAPATRQARNSI